MGRRAVISRLTGNTAPCLYPLFCTGSRADPGFLERRFICLKVRGFVLLILSHFPKISHENEIIWSLIFIGYLKNGGGGGGGGRTT